MFLKRKFLWLSLTLLSQVLWAGSLPCDVKISKERVYAGDPILVALKSETGAAATAQLVVGQKSLQSVHLPPHEQVLFQFPTPLNTKAMALGSIVMDVAVSSDASAMTCQFTPLSPVYIYPLKPRFYLRSKSIGAGPVYLFDPSGQISKELKFLKVKFQNVTVLSDFHADPSSLLIVGPHVFSSAALPKPEFLVQQVKQGMRLIIMEQDQENPIYSLLGVRLANKELPVSAFQFSALVLPSDIPRPQQWGLRSMLTRAILPLGTASVTPLVHVFPKNSPELMPTLTFPLGDGMVVLNQLDIANQLDVEPLARVIFGNLLEIMARNKKAH